MLAFILPIMISINVNIENKLVIENFKRIKTGQLVKSLENKTVGKQAIFARKNSRPFAK